MSSEDDADIWPEDVEKAFQEALLIYPAIGRRKLMENGKMYGRNELIAKYIYAMTKKSRTRKQVSSHIQVLGKKAKKAELAAQAEKHQPQAGVPSSSAATGTPTTAPLASTAAPSPSQPKTSGTTDPPQYNQNYMENSRPQLDLSSLQTLAASAMPANYIPVHSPRTYAEQEMMNASFTTGTSPFLNSSKFLPPYENMKNDSPVNITSNRSYPMSPTVANFAPVSDNGLPMAMKKFPSGLRVNMKYFSAYMEHENHTYSGLTQVSRHVYVHLTTDNIETSFQESELETTSLSGIKGQFPTLVDLYNQGPSSAFFVAKFWAHLNTSQQHGIHVLTSKYESREAISIKCTTTVYSFGKPVVEKIQNGAPIPEANGAYAYYFTYSPMCEYMVFFIDKLKAVGNTQDQNKVLSNFTVMQVLTDIATNTILLSTAFLFSVSDQVPRTQVYKLVP